MFVNAEWVLAMTRDLIGVGETRFGVVRERSASGAEVVHGHAVCQGSLAAPHPRAGGVLVSDVATLEEVLATACESCAGLCSDAEWLRAMLGPLVRVAEAVVSDDESRDVMWGRAVRGLRTNPRGNISLDGMRSLLALAPIEEGGGRLAMVPRMMVQERDVAMLVRGAWHAIESEVSLVWVRDRGLPAAFEVLSESADSVDVAEFAALWSCYAASCEWRDVREVWELSRAVSSR